MIGQFQDFVSLGVGLIVFAMGLWAFIDCLRRPANYFPYIERKSKVLWLILTGLGAAVGLLVILNPLNLFGMASIVISLIYLFDLRPKFEQMNSRRY